MKKVIFTQGLPSSGKTTWALKQIELYPETVKRINKDDLRAMIDGGKYTSGNESEINELIKIIIVRYLFVPSVVVVIIDGCNLAKHIESYTAYVQEMYDEPVNFYNEVFDVSPQICIERNKIRNIGFPEKAIWQILDRYHQDEMFLDYKLQGDTMKSWIGFDLDGTIAHYDGWKGPNHIGEPIETMMNLLKAEREKGKVKIFTARACIPEQIQPIRDWLTKHGLEDVEITNVKDFGMTLLYDDRCIQVEQNTGLIIE